MRVLVVAPTPFFGDRGCHVRILGQARALRQLGVELLLVTYPIGRDVPDLATVRAPRLPWVRQLPVGFSIHKPYLDLLLLATALRAARRFHPDVVHGHLHEGAVLATVVGRVAGCPAVADLQGSMTDEMVAHRTIPARGPLPALVRRVEQALVRWPARLLSSSAHLAAELETRWGVAAERVVRLPDGVDADTFRPGIPADDLRERLGLRGKQVVVYLGVLTGYQGVDDLLAAWPAVVAALPAAHLLLMGYPNVERYRQEVERLGLHGSVTLTGRVDYAESPRYLALGDVGVSPKHASTEANGKLLHYMAAGLPAVAYDGPVARELLGDAGTLVPARDVKALGDALILLLEDPAERARRGRALRERALREFAWPALARRLLGAYRDCGAAPSG
jgi:glycosyltransferase involved in cell wall biosynthesis